MALQINANVVNTTAAIDATQSLDSATTDTRSREADNTIAISDSVVRLQDNNVAVKNEIRADAHKEVRTFNGIGARNQTNLTQARAGAENVAPPKTDAARVEAQVAAEVGNKAQTQTTTGAASGDAVRLETGDTGKAVESAGGQSSASEE
ncbi:MAG: hypothetical protein RIT81_26790 [Deltaproteobacteria bacterium]